MRPPAYRAIGRRLMRVMFSPCEGVAMQETRADPNLDDETTSKFSGQSSAPLCTCDARFKPGFNALGAMLHWTYCLTM